MNRDLAFKVREQEFFHGLSEQWLDLIAGCAKNQVAKAGEFLFREGEKADTFYIIREGDVALEFHAPHRAPLIIETLHVGDVLGWSWLIPPYRWHFDAVARSRLHLLAFDGACLRNKMASEPSLGFEMMQKFFPVVLDRLQATRLRLMDMYANPNGSAVR